MSETTRRRPRGIPQILKEAKNGLHPDDALALRDWAEQLQADRNKYAALAEGYQNDLVDKAAEVTRLQGEVSLLTAKITGRDNTIERLEKIALSARVEVERLTEDSEANYDENVSLHAHESELEMQVAARDAKIAELEARIAAAVEYLDGWTPKSIGIRMAQRRLRAALRPEDSDA